MFVYVARRVVYVIPIIISVALVCFMLVHITPGDPLVAVLPADASQELANQLRAAYGFDRPLPVPMNEYLQQALAECYFDVQIDVIEWNTLFTNWRRGAKDPSANGANATNVTYAAMDPFFALVRFLQSSMAPPVSNNWGYINNPKFDELVTKARQTFDPVARDAALAELHAASVDDATFLYVAHDVAPRAMSPKVKGFVQPKSWFVDFSTMTMN